MMKHLRTPLFCYWVHKTNSLAIQHWQVAKYVHLSFVFRRFSRSWHFHEFLAMFLFWFFSNFDRQIIRNPKSSIPHFFAFFLIFLFFWRNLVFIFCLLLLSRGWVTIIKNVPLRNTEKSRTETFAGELSLSTLTQFRQFDYFWLRYVWSALNIIGGFCIDKVSSSALKKKRGKISFCLLKKSRQIQMRQILVFHKIWKVRQNNEFKFQ